MGFILNLEKSHLSPQTFQWVGLRWHTRTAHLSLPEVTTKDVLQCGRRFVTHPVASRRSLERLIGKLQFTSVVDPICKTLLKGINKFWLSHAWPNLKDRRVKTPHRLNCCIKRWLLGISLRRKVLWKSPPPSLDIYTDMFLTGWGFRSSDVVPDVPKTLYQYPGAGHGLHRSELAKTKDQIPHQCALQQLHSGAMHKLRGVSQVSCAKQFGSV